MGVNYCRENFLFELHFHVQWRLKIHCILAIDTQLILSIRNDYSLIVQMYSERVLQSNVL